MDALLEKLDRWHDGIPKELLREAVKRQEAITPGLIGALEELAGNPQAFLDNPERNLFYWAAYLLAHFEEEKALAAMLKVVRLSGGKFNDLVADLVGEDGAMLLANVSGGKTEGIAELLHDAGAGVEARIAAADALGMLMTWGAVGDELVKNEFGKALDSLGTRDLDLGAVLVNAATDLNLRELAPKIQAAYDRKAVDTDFADWEFVAEWLHDPDFEPPPPYLLHVQAIDDIVEFFEEKIREEEMMDQFDPDKDDEGR